MRLLLRTRPYEREGGAAMRLHDLWAERIKDNIRAEAGSASAGTSWR